MVKGTLQSSPAGEDPAILPRKISFHGRIKKGCSFRGKGGVVLQVQNSAHAWQELPCGYTHHRRFWHVFEWAEWYSWGEFCSYETRVFWWDSAFSRVSADVFCFFFSSFFCKNFTYFFILVMQVFARTCRRRLSYHQALFGKYLHLQYNVFVIYDEAKAVPQRPSHNKVPQKHAANRQGNTSHRSMIPTKLLLCIFVEITLRHGCPRPL